MAVTIDQYDINRIKKEFDEKGHSTDFMRVHIDGHAYLLYTRTGGLYSTNVNYRSGRSPEGNPVSVISQLKLSPFSPGKPYTPLFSGGKSAPAQAKSSGGSSTRWDVSAVKEVQLYAALAKAGGYAPLNSVPVSPVDGQGGRLTGNSMVAMTGHTKNQLTPSKGGLNTAQYADHLDQKMDNEAAFKAAVIKGMEKNPGLAQQLARTNGYSNAAAFITDKNGGGVVQNPGQTGSGQPVTTTGTGTVQPAPLDELDILATHNGNAVDPNASRRAQLREQQRQAAENMDAARLQGIFDKADGAGSGPLVALLQSILNALGFDVDLTGTMNPETRQQAAKAETLLKNREAIIAEIDADGADKVTATPDGNGLKITVDGEDFEFEQEEILQWGTLEALIDNTNEGAALKQKIIATDPNTALAKRFAGGGGTPTPIPTPTTDQMLKVNTDASGNAIDLQIVNTADGSAYATNASGIAVQNTSMTLAQLQDAPNNQDQIAEFFDHVVDLGLLDTVDAQIALINADPVNPVLTVQHLEQIKDAVDAAPASTLDQATKDAIKAEIDVELTRLADAVPNQQTAQKIKLDQNSSGVNVGLSIVNDVTVAIPTPADLLFVDSNVPPRPVPHSSVTLAQLINPQDPAHAADLNGFFLNVLNNTETLPAFASPNSVLGQGGLNMTQAQMTALGTFLGSQTDIIDHPNAAQLNTALGGVIPNIPTGPAQPPVQPPVQPPGGQTQGPTLAGNVAGAAMGGAVGGVAGTMADTVRNRMHNAAIATRASEIEDAIYADADIENQAFDLERQAAEIEEQAKLAQSEHAVNEKNRVYAETEGTLQKTRGERVFGLRPARQEEIAKAHEMRAAVDAEVTRTELDASGNRVNTDGRSIVNDMNNRVNAGVQDAGRPGFARRVVNGSVGIGRQIGVPWTNLNIGRAADALGNWQYTSWAIPTPIENSQARVAELQDQSGTQARDTRREVSSAARTIEGHLQDTADGFRRDAANLRATSPSVPDPIEQRGRAGRNKWAIAGAAAGALLMGATVLMAAPANASELSPEIRQIADGGDLATAGGLWLDQNPDKMPPELMVIVGDNPEMREALGLSIMAMTYDDPEPMAIFFAELGAGSEVVEKIRNLDPSVIADLTGVTDAIEQYQAAETASDKSDVVAGNTLETLAWLTPVGQVLGGLMMVRAAAITVAEARDIPLPSLESMHRETLLDWVYISDGEQEYRDFVPELDAFMRGHKLDENTPQTVVDLVKLHADWLLAEQALEEAKAVDLPPVYKTLERMQALARIDDTRAVAMQMQELYETQVAALSETGELMHIRSYMDAMDNRDAQPAPELKQTPKSPTEISPVFAEKAVDPSALPNVDLTPFSMVFADDGGGPQSPIFVTDADGVATNEAWSAYLEAWDSSPEEMAARVTEALSMADVDVGAFPDYRMALEAFYADDTNGRPPGEKAAVMAGLGILNERVNPILTSEATQPQQGLGKPA